MPIIVFFDLDYGLYIWPDGLWKLKLKLCADEHIIRIRSFKDTFVFYNFIVNLPKKAVVKECQKPYWISLDNSDDNLRWTAVECIELSSRGQNQNSST